MTSCKASIVPLMVAQLFASFIVLGVSAQEHNWDKYKPHALKAWEAYREQFECVAISGKDSAGGYKFDFYFDKSSGSALFTMIAGYRPNQFIKHIIVERDRCTFLEKASNETEFKLVREISTQVTDEQDDVQYSQDRIARILFPSMDVLGKPIDKIVEQGEAKILAVAVDEKTPNLVTVELEISENLLMSGADRVESPELVRIGVIFDAEKLWTIKSYNADWPSGRRYSVNHETVAFLGCAAPNRSTSTSAFPDGNQDFVVQIEVSTRTWSIISPELFSSKIAEARALVEK